MLPQLLKVKVVNILISDTSLGKSQYWVPRIQLMFESEDSEMFALRVKEAYEERQKTEAHLRYHLYLDCMPMDGVTEVNLNLENVSLPSKIQLNSVCLGWSMCLTKWEVLHLIKGYSRVLDVNGVCAIPKMRYVEIQLYLPILKFRWKFEKEFPF